MSALDRGEWSASCPGRFILSYRLDRSQSGHSRDEESRSHVRAARRNTDCAIPAPSINSMWTELQSLLPMKRLGNSCRNEVVSTIFFSRFDAELSHITATSEEAEHVCFNKMRSPTILSLVVLVSQTFPSVSFSETSTEISLALCT
jgi:hypothetical protein